MRPLKYYSERSSKFNRLIGEANEAKDRLARIASDLEELGYVRKARSCMTLVALIEEWQRRGA